jgi:hypothetical protein
VRWCGGGFVAAPFQFTSKSTKDIAPKAHSNAGLARFEWLSRCAALFVSLVSLVVK